MVLGGIPYSLVTQHTVQKVFVLDPFGGWWGLNFGHNMVYPTEALYHSLSFGCFLCLLRRRYALAAVLALIFSWSHPYSGVEILLILVSWSAFELFFVQQGAVPVGFFAAVLTVLGLHFGYYLVFLTRFPEHRALMKTLALPWLLQAANFLPAYACRWGPGRLVFSTPGTRPDVLRKPAEPLFPDLVHRRFRPGEPRVRHQADCSPCISQGAISGRPCS